MTNKMIEEVKIRLAKESLYMQDDVLGLYVKVIRDEIGEEVSVDTITERIKRKLRSEG